MEAASLHAIEVVGGVDDGARLRADAAVRLIGRSYEADLVLHDPYVSRRHAQLTADEQGVTIALCGDTPPATVYGVYKRIFELKAGDTVVLGRTTLRVVREDQQATSAGRGTWTDIRTLLTGVSEDTRALAAVHSLIQALDAATTRAELDAALDRWAEEHVRAVEPATFDERDDCGNGVRAVAVSAEVQAISVPAPADGPLRMTVRCDVRRKGDGDLFARTLVVAGRLFGSSVARIRRSDIAEAQVAELRAVSVGSARAFLGTSAAARRVADLIPRLAASDVSVLIDGETGVGKTFVARLIHEAGARAAEPLRVLNCAAIPEHLAEAELFGHERGAFTGAVAARAGAFEAAGRGTLVLDEIAELSLAMQSKLLHVLEERKFERVGSNRSLDVRARIICATNRDLEKMVQAKEFRSDLFFRIAVVRILVPPLRDRGDDLILLSQQLLTDASRHAARRITGLSPSAIHAIRSYSWPGNVRELRNAIDHAVALGEGRLVDAKDLPTHSNVGADQPEDLDLVRLPIDLATAERRVIDAAVRHSGGNRVKAAALLGVSRQTLYSKLGEPKGR